MGLLQDQNERLFQSWRIVIRENVKLLEDTVFFEEELKKIVGKYLKMPVGSAYY
jgi:hypothetical protein